MAFLFLFAFVASACGKPQPGAGDGVASSKASEGPADAAPRPAARVPLELIVAYGSEKKTWFEEAVRAFEATGAQTDSGRPIRVRGKAMGSGECVQAIVSGDLRAHVFSPASQAYVTLLNDAWREKTARPKALAPAGEVLVLSPVVIAMWRSMAEALGWPKASLGWSDLLAISADPRGWGAKGRSEWGRFKLGHTHPSFSNSGLLAVLAEGYAGAKKTRGLSVADLDAKATRAYLSALEGTVIHYGKSTGFFADKMMERGPGYISAAVLYENLVVESYRDQARTNGAIVAIYPKEGTFWSDHPWSVLDADWVGPEERQAAGKLGAFLKAKPQQTRALELGFRPGDASLAVGAPIDAAHGCDAKQPQTLLELPDAPVMQKLLAVWNETKKGADVVFVFDKSGSMNGKPLDEAKRGAKGFFANLANNDDASLLFFDNRTYPIIGPVRMDEKGRSMLVQRIDGIAADGGTALYDAVNSAYGALEGRAKKDPTRMHAIVGMTDGKDQDSKMKLEALKSRFPTEETAIRVFTIAYGSEANPSVLAEIASAARGSSMSGGTENIQQIYADLAAFF
jgi:Ca-activated chloride channel family protein